MEVYGATGYAITVGPDQIRLRHQHERESAVANASAAPLSAPQNDSLNYLAAVLRGEIESKGDLTALDTNVIVMQILDAARESARTGKSIRLTKLAD
jgi:predicted dehydrogenase